MSNQNGAAVRSFHTPPNKSLDVRAKQRLSFRVVRLTQTGLVAVSPHVNSVVGRNNLLFVVSKQFMQTDLVSIVSKTLNDSGLQSHCLKLEVTESAMVEDIEFAVDVMQKLKEIGIKLSIDDFGTGYSSLSYLHRLPLSSLKIDRSFVNQMNDSEENQEIIKTIVSLAKSLNLETIAEGIETKDQIAELTALSCQFGQGFYYAKPLLTTAVEEMFAERTFDSDEIHRSNTPYINIAA